MNEKVDLTKILKDCPKGWKFYSSMYGEVEFSHINVDYEYPIVIRTNKRKNKRLSSEGKLLTYYDGECTLFPSKDQRDWSKFTAPWYKKERFNPGTLQPFDKVLIFTNDEWQCDFFSHMLSGDIFNKRCIGMGDKNIVIPYNDDTKHLIGAKEEVSEFYKYWED